MDTVTLTADHGKHKTGTEFEVVKVAGSTTIVTTGGKRVILPNSKLDGLPAGVSTAPVGAFGKEPATPKVAMVELNVQQNDLYNAIEEGIAESEYLADYISSSGLDEGTAMKDLQFIKDHIEKGSSFTVVVAPVAVSGTASTMVPGVSMGSAEIRVLGSLLGGDTSKFEAEELSVSGDTIEDAPPELGPDQVWFTDITNGRLPDSGINHLIQQYSETHWEEEHRCHIPKVDPLHYWDVEVLETLILAHTLREKALITGLPGTGKSSSVKQFAAWLKQPYMRLGGRGDLESSSFLGYSWADAEEIGGELVSKMVFKAGMLTQGVQWGYLVTIDEVMKIPSYIQMSMQHLYEKDGYLTIDDKPGTQEDKIVYPKFEFLMVLTDNVKGTGDSFDKFSATQMQDGSTLDRINLNETLSYLEPAQEKKMLTAMYPKANTIQVEKLIKLAGLVRNGYKQGSIALTLSPRGLIAVLSMVDVGIPVKRATALAFTNKIADESELLAIADMLKTVAL